ncbi:hypothetical protein WG66_010445 [Moniliophthora roreri]|nr:hypothetical protein WG66_010445 [Moniliophthora roreri]
MNTIELILLVVSVISTTAAILWASVLVRYRALYTPITGIQGGGSALVVLRFCDWFLSFAIAVTYFYIRERGLWDFTKPGILFYFLTPKSDAKDIIFPVLLTILRLPFHVLIVRATTTRYILSYRRPAVAFRVLLSPKERRAPWMLFAIPGLFLGFVLQTVIPLGLTNLSGRLMYPHFDIWRNALDILFAQLLISLGSTALCVPLYVANTRLAMSAQCPTRQPQQDQEAGDTQLSERRLWDAQEAELFGLATYCREEEDPIVFRGHLHSPYTGLVDCLATIEKEEGVGTLFRGWGLSVLGLAFNGVEVEDKGTGWVLVGWESIEHHIRMNDHPNHPAILADFFQACVGTPTIVHVETDGNFKPFEHPVLQLVNIKLKNLENKDRLETLLEKIKVRYTGRSTWGGVKEEAGAYKLFTGWQTVEEHLNAMKMDDTEGAADGKALTELTEFTIVHVPLHTPNQEWAHRLPYA